MIDALAATWRIDLSREKFHGWYGDGRVGEHRVCLLKPTTFMNRSGRAVAAAVRFFQMEPEALLVVLDDHALPLGRIRMRGRGSGGGHNGLQDTIDWLGTSDFARLRLGIDEPIGDPAGYVLSKFAAAEEPMAEQMIETAADAAAYWMDNGYEATMNRFNAKATGD